MDENKQEDQRHCAECGAEIASDAPEGICPRCVLQGAADDVERETVAQTATLPGMEPPTVEEITAAFPQFEVLELIGSGGMGAVFKVRQPRLDRVVALKVLPRRLAEEAQFVGRFHREARALAKLNHPNIVAVHDFGESGGFPYLLMEYVDGANLREAMRAGKCTPEEAFAVVPEICAALQYAHDEGVLHRDIKPENLLLDTRGRVKIADFGIAKLVGEEIGVEPQLTGSLVPGTPQYMAPEQLERTSDVDHRADIYSLGVVFYEMLTGELPIGRFAAPSEKTGVGGTVDDIVFRSLSKEPDQRQQSAGDFKTQVEGAAGEPMPSTSAAKSTPKRPRRLGKIAVGSILLGGSMLLFLMVPIVVQLSQAQFKQRTLDLRQEMDEEMRAARAEEAKLKIRAVTAWNGRSEIPEMERLRYTEAHTESLAHVRALEEEHQAKLRNREQSRRTTMMTASLIIVGIWILCGAVAIAGIALMVSGWRARRAARLSNSQPE